MENLNRQEALVALRMYGFATASTDNLIELESFSNHVWKFGDKNQSYILRQYSKISYEKLIRQNLNLVHLISCGIPIPNILKNLNGTYAIHLPKWSYDLSEFIPHLKMKYPDMNISDFQIRQAAGLLAKIHNTPLEQLPFHPSDKSVEEVNTSYILQLISEFQSLLAKGTYHATSIEKTKLYNLQKLIRLTDNNRRKFLDQGEFSLGKFSKTLSHGDFSLSNLLPEPRSKKMYIVDWENMGIRARAWELHRTLLLICGKGYCNSNFDELDFDRAVIFLDTYLKNTNLSLEEISFLPRIAEYVSLFHWLRFTLESVSRGDNRILEKIPEDISRGLW
ncbi:aminoglycoside phosphotransferase family protein, partial [Candidatus Dojkabacteria bacterium]|nr:aminoglycoside phosphotransferase family protein [Candidatus Dojkabacteria bacterium]